MPSKRYDARRVDPWFHARNVERDYITPEDVTAAIKAGASEALLLRTVLAAIERGTVEDVSLTCFVALGVKGDKATQRQRPARDE